MKKTKILFVLPNLLPGGAEKVTINILKSLDKNLFDINLLLIKKIGIYEELLPRYVNIIDLNKNKTLYSYYSFISNIKKINPDIIFSSLNRTNILLLLSRVFFPKIKIVLREPNMPSKDLHTAPIMTQYLTKKLYKYADLIIAQTDEMRNEIIEHYSNIKSNSIITINNPIDTNDIDFKIKEIPRNLFPSDKKIIVAAGSLIKRKGFDILINAFNIIYKDKKDLELYILGDGIEKDNLQIQVNKLNLNKNIHFLGYKSNPYIYFKKADLFVLSSKWEGLPNVVLECLYLGIPVVITDCVNFTSEIVKKSKMGEVVDIDDVDSMAESILKVLNSDFKESKFDYQNFDFNKLFINVMEKK